MPSFETADDTEEFAVVDFIIALSGIERVGGVSTGVPVTVNILLL